MYFYQVWIGSARYHKPEPLTYSSNDRLPPGEVVTVPLKQQVVWGFAVKKIVKPRFAVKAISRRTHLILPPRQQKLFDWLLNYYPAPSGQIAQLFIPKNLPQKVPSKRPVAPLQLNDSHLPPLTPEQQTALTLLEKQVRGSVLLHGDTGTGKTRLYLELAKHAICSDQSVVILTPEIGLTPQLAATFKEVFGTNVIVTHSHLSEAQRREIWCRVATSNTPQLIIGPRSALFLPIKKLGLIVVDEAHDSSYKQEQAPHYQATRVAAKLAQLHQCLAVFGTATPLVSDYFGFQKHQVPIIRMTQPVHATIRPPRITTVDRTNKELFSASWLFSNPLIEAIERTKKAGLTSLLFLNRRGTARLLLCQQCGWQAECPNCDVPVTYHGDLHLLRCHLCGYHTAPPLSCPACQSSELSFHAAGTKALEQELTNLFPGYRILRVDSDTTAAQRLERQYQQLKAGHIDLLVGTQMISKGLDLPHLGLVGIPFADSSLYLPDYTADEQTFQLLSQVIGRVGRTTQATEVIIQTYNSAQPTIQAATHKNWNNFYNDQLKERRAFGYPPFSYLLQVTLSRKQESTLKTSGQKLVQHIAANWPEVTVLGPAPRFHRKTQGVYQWQVIVKAPQRSLLIEIIKQLPTGWRYNIDPVTLL